MEKDDSAIDTEKESTTELKDAKDLYERYDLEVASYKSATKSWYKNGEEIVKTYKNDKHKVRYNIEWSTIQLLQPAIYARTPKPQIERRFKDSDPVARVASELLQRALTYEIETQPFDVSMKAVRDDYLLPGRGSGWVRLDSKTTTDESGEESILYKCVPFEHVFWKDFGYNIARDWKNVCNVWATVYLTKPQAQKAFGNDMAKKLTYATFRDLEDKTSTETKTHFKKAEIFELWDKERREVFWFSRSLKDEFLKWEKDPLKLRNFFPCPRPVFATITTDINVPTPDFCITENIAKDLDLINQRIALLTEACKMAGLTDKNFYIEVKRLVECNENDIIPIPNYMALKQQGGTQNLVEWLPIEQIAKVLGQLYQAKSQLEGDYNRIRGISGIASGFTSPYESAKTQQMKGMFTNIRLTDRQEGMQKFIAETFNLMAEIIAEHFSPDEILKMANGETFQEADKMLFPQAIALLKDDVTRNFKITVESDSNLALDDAAEKQSMNEYISSVGQFLSQSAQMTQMAPALRPVTFEMLKMAARRYKAGRNLEGILETGLSTAIEEAKAAAQQPPPPSPEQIEAQMEQQKLQGKMALDNQKAQNKAQIESMKTQNEAMLAQAKMQYEMQIEQVKMQNMIALKEAEMNYKMQLEQAKLQNQALLQQQELQQKQVDLLRNTVLSQQNDKTPPESAAQPIIVNVDAKQATKKIAKFSSDSNGNRVALISDLE